ncbi:MAG: hypothetical protein M2R46_04345 [Verrucomicrobia subdivision 3 bacterium]|nr:hypothetical protein [Limisphaerales bacterium]
MTLLAWRDEVFDQELLYRDSLISYRHGLMLR